MPSGQVTLCNRKLGGGPIPCESEEGERYAHVAVVEVGYGIEFGLGGTASARRARGGPASVANLSRFAPVRCKTSIYLPYLLSIPSRLAIAHFTTTLPSPSYLAPRQYASKAS